VGQAERAGGLLDPAVDTVYFGGGTPTLLDVTQLSRIFVTIRQKFKVSADAEITVECAPGTLSEPMLKTFERCGVNRVSLGVQSFIDREASSVGRMHKAEIVMNDLERLRAAGITNINVDLIAGLPHQTGDSWEQSLNRLIESEVPHASIYMLEVDEESRLGRELMAGGQKYHAHFVPDEDLTAELYESACDRLNAAGIAQYEISNFAKNGFESKHNLKYWTRQPYLGLGVDAHSMLRGKSSEAVRFANPDSLPKYLAGEKGERSEISGQTVLEESLFLGLRLNRGVNADDLKSRFGTDAFAEYERRLAELTADGLLEQRGATFRLTSRGRLLSNEVFQQFITTAVG
jgi:oxygen-independent coproporphyrinogen-3 oxidase